MCREMQPPGQHSRINLADLKAQIVTKLGVERSKQYFYFLSMFLSSKINRVELNKIFSSIVNRETIPLHNQFISSILKNACGSKIPPPVYKQDISKYGTREIQANGNWKAMTPPPAVSNSEFGSNGKRSVRKGLKIHSAILTRTGLAGSSEGKEEEASAWSSLHAPLGVPLCPQSVGGARRAVHSSNVVSSSDLGVLLDSVALKERMEQIAATQGLEGVTGNCVNLLNNGLNCYLKNLLSSCIQLSPARSDAQQTPSKYINGVIHGVRSEVSISLQDFRVAMEMDPLQLGEDWPTLLEEICVHSFEE